MAPAAEIYTLTAEEKAAMTALNFGVVNAKAQLRDLEIELRTAEKRFEGGLQLLGLSHGMTSMRLSDDLSTLTKTA